MPIRVNLIGKRYHRLVVVSLHSTGMVTKWNCLCDCGSAITTRHGSLTHGRVKSCGCLRKENTSKINKTHGLSETPEYAAWQAMLTRCTNKNHREWHRYGGRGIKICKLWRHSFTNFFESMGLKPSPKHTLDRIDNDRDYCPENCQWATQKQQQGNKATNRIITIDGESKPLFLWAEISPVTYACIRRRLRRGWSAKNAIFIPKQKAGRQQISRK